MAKIKDRLKREGKKIFVRVLRAWCWIQINSVEYKFLGRRALLAQKFIFDTFNFLK
jgi:hypothetical protein